MHGILRGFSSIVILMALLLLTGVLAYHAGYEESKKHNYEIVEVIVPVDTSALEESGYIDSNEQLNEEWLMDFLETVQSANITMQYDSRGYKTGVVSIYFERQKQCSLCDKIRSWASTENATHLTIFVSKD